MALQSRLRTCRDKPRVFVLSDIANEPDDAESLVRLLCYGNELEIVGLVACTSVWMRKSVHPEEMHRIVGAYADVVSNLNAHVHTDNPYPDAAYLLSLITAGPPLYGKEALEPDVPLSDGAASLVEKLEATDLPLWVLSWGGMNVLAQALQHIHRTRSEADAAKLRSKLRVYAISDQDDTGLWIRVKFPDIFYICSVHGWKDYGMAAWTGISGDLLRPLDEGGPDRTRIERGWIKEHIQIGPLGELYPDYKFIMEGDTPTFLYLIQNGLGSRENPHWGSWGGRYVLTDLGGAAKHYADTRDTVVGKNGNIVSSNKATIWRWRNAFQNDFAARMQWTLTSDRSKANHPPVVVVNESDSGPEPLLLEAEAGSEIILDASKSYDPDGDDLAFKWFQYKEPTTAQSCIHWPGACEVDFESVDDTLPNGAVVKVTMPPLEKSAVDILTGKALEKGQVLHLILEVTDTGVPSLTTYKRVVVQITNVKLRGGSSKAYETITDALDA